ncbi:hypothetical protein NMQ14_18900 [Methyloversatilis sp. XJ19-13]|uniref:dimethylamine monooxygenase subunit DmmA family protein n=1 Tax=Methyloversatilis sp. XJ19-13 TaxID=2963430 RepID=UPI00211CC73C|nr:dimethylamine monooxygenase subunit DmmA family protein [Methyloversatilis sp. XJ19-13]MCQ9376315.1 hypothetical protein [Methyloversatilis sp. XJ19-13]
MSTPAIKSQPVYTALEWDRAGTHHVLFAAADESALARRLWAQPPTGPITLILQHAGGEPMTGWLADRPASVHTIAATTLDLALKALGDTLRAAQMGTRLYLVGPEDAIWQAARLADGFGMSRDEMRLMQAGTRARPVFCVHCRTVTRGVHTHIAPCSGCGRALFVRDHFSRRLGAYMGFQIDAEAPGDIPAAEVIYP